MRHLRKTAAFLVLLGLLTTPAPVGGKTRALIPNPPEGTLLVGPYLVGASSSRMVIRWEIQGERAGTIDWRGPDGTPRLDAGVLLLAEPETIELPGRMYQVELSDLEPCATYEYRLDPFESDRRGYPHTFRTPPRSGETCPGGTRVMVYGDSRTNHNTHTSLMPVIERSKPHLALNVGDIVHTARRVYEWHKFFQIEGRLLGSTPMDIVPGNHEGYKDEAFGQAMMRRYFQHDQHSGIGHRVIDAGRARFVLLDNYWGADLSGKGRIWLDEQLGSTPKGWFKFVVMHVPIYSFSHHQPTETLKALRPILAKHRVNSVFAGHAHVYEHFDVDGVHYLTLGGTGAPFHEPREHVVPKEEQYYRKGKAFYHVLLIDLDEAAARFRVIDTKTGKVADEWQIEAR